MRPTEFRRRYLQDSIDALWTCYRTKYPDLEQIRAQCQAVIKRRDSSLSLFNSHKEYISSVAVPPDDPKKSAMILIKVIFEKEQPKNTITGSRMIM
ncbi:hypothetical protein GEMRC1_005968 [Eukaryota sp. GEM-RC1]